MRKLPFGKTVNPPQADDIGAPIGTEPKTVPDCGSILKTIGSAKGHPVSAYKIPLAKARAITSESGRGLGKDRVSWPPAPSLNGATLIKSVGKTPSTSSV